MNNFTTKLSKHCYYGNISNILNYYGNPVSESELILLSNSLNCNVNCNESLSFGIRNQHCSIGLKKLGYKINVLEEDYSSYRFALKNNYPILIKINSGKLTHHIVFKGTNRNHYLVIIKEKNNLLEISDSYIPTLSTTSFQGFTESHFIKQEVRGHNVTGCIIEKECFAAENYVIEDLLNKYIANNLSKAENSNIKSLILLDEFAIENTEMLLNSTLLKNISYNIKTAGWLAHYEYLFDLFLKYEYCSLEELNRLMSLKSKWNLIINKILKCSFTLDKITYAQIFSNDIPCLVDMELMLYNDICKRRLLA